MKSYRTALRIKDEYKLTLTISTETIVSGLLLQWEIPSKPCPMGIGHMDLCKLINSTIEHLL